MTYGEKNLKVSGYIYLYSLCCILETNAILQINYVSIKSILKIWSHYWAHVPQLLKPQHIKPMLCNKKSHHSEKPTHCNQRIALPCCHYRKPVQSNEDPVQFSHSFVSYSLRPHGLQHARPPCPSPTPGAYLNSCPLTQWCHPTVWSSVIPFSSCLQSLPPSGSFWMSWFFKSGGQIIGISASTSVLPMKIHDLFPLRMDWLYLLAVKGLSRVFSNTTVQKHQVFGAQFSF